jgi:hypothetical protein
VEHPLVRGSVFFQDGVNDDDDSEQDEDDTDRPPAEPASIMITPAAS